MFVLAILLVMDKRALKINSALASSVLRYQHSHQKLVDLVSRNACEAVLTVVRADFRRDCNAFMFRAAKLKRWLSYQSQLNGSEQRKAPHLFPINAAHYGCADQTTHKCGLSCPYAYKGGQPSLNCSWHGCLKDQFPEHLNSSNHE